LLVNKTAGALVLYGFAAIAVAGCGSATAPISKTGPLTVDAWKELDPAEKYDEATFDRLKQHDPKLKSGSEWVQFMRKVVIPERNADMPDTIPAGK
jgi:hypothetical protein